MKGGTSLKGKTFAITGAGSGIGRAIALACAREGANLCLSGRTLSKIEETVALIEQERCDGHAIAVEANITSADAVERMYARVVSVFGALEGIVANAGVMAPSPPLHEIPEAAWREAIDINLMGAVNTVSHGAKLLIKQGRGGVILATGSSIAIRPSTATATYSTSKAALHAFMKVAALELAPHRIRVNTIVPGTSATPPLQRIEGFLERIGATLPLGEVVSPDELGRLAAFVLSDATPHMTGAALVVDSGRTIA